MGGNRKTDWICVLLLLFAWIMAALIVNPVGDFPLNDDWAYGSAVRTLVEKRDLRLSDWTATNLVAQVFWGALFCLPVGFSFTALRVSTLTLGLVGVVATYGLLREVRASAMLAFFGSLVFAFSPIYFALSFTFMSDVPFAAIATAASYLLLRGLRRDSCLEIVGGLALAGVAILIRQIGLALPFAFAAAYILRYGLSIRRVLQATLPISAGLALQIGFEAWLRWSDRLPATYGRQIHTLQMQLHHAWPSVFGDAMTILFFAFLYTGLFLFPLLIATNGMYRSRGSAALLLIVTGMSAITTAAMAGWVKLMPLHGNILHKGGLGCCDDDSSQAPSYFWMLITFFSVLGAILLFIGLGRSVLSLRKNGEQRYPLAFALIAIIACFAPLPFLGLGYDGFYDRYLIVFLPWLTLMLVAAKPPITNFRVSYVTLLVSTVTLIGIGTFSIAATHDYLAASRVRWTALNQLLGDGVDPERIDGGFEFGGWYLYDIPYAHHKGQCCYWVVKDEYALHEFERKGYTTLTTYDIDHWLPWRRSNLIVQRKIDSSGTR
jgi:hypothetical protein